MEKIELYWEIANQSIMIINLIFECLLFSVFIKPFIKGKSYLVGLTYLVVMLVFTFVPTEISYAKFKATLVALIVMFLIERKNFKQKVFLATSMYLFCWLVYGVTLILRNVLLNLSVNLPYMYMEPIKQLTMYVFVELIYYGISIVGVYWIIRWVHKVYANKKEDISGKELLLFFTPLLTIMTGRFAFSFFSNVYLSDTGIYVWNNHPEYDFWLTLYRFVSLMTVIITIGMYQNLKKRQYEEKINILLEEQIENTKQYISEVEELYGNIRALKHDMGNHITVLETLSSQNEKEEFEKYLAELKITWKDSMAEIKTGNPVTDIIIIQKQKEAEEKGIDFKCNFVYPGNDNVNAFDFSVILSNALTNAIEGTKECKNPYILVSTYRKKNAYLLEVTNCIKNSIVIDEETGLPETTKKDRSNHGFGLVNIRKVAQKYYGDIDISQTENTFTLTVMLMLE